MEYFDRIYVRMKDFGDLVDITNLDEEAERKAVKAKEKFAIEFATWVESLTPSDRVSVWSKDGQYKGLFNMDMEQLLEKYKRLKK